jgi:hypothetical protein
MQAGCPVIVVPYDQSRLIKNPNLVSINYTNQDFWSMKARLVDYIKEKFADDFNDFVESSIAIMLIENWAYIADTLSFKIDQIANEIFIDTVSETDNAFRLSQLVGFKPTPPIAARSLWSATSTQILETDLTIDVPVSIDITTEVGARTIELFAADNNNNPIFNGPIIIPAGGFINTSIVGVEGQTREQIERGDGSINQFFQLGFGPVIWNSIRLYVDGVAWEQVDYFTDSQPRREFRVEYDPDYNAFILFGNNRAGMIPSNNSEIRVLYRTGGGVAGNIVTGSVELQRNFVLQGFDLRIPVTFRNYTKGEFGYVGDGIEDIKRKLPPYLRTQNRCVTGDDYQTFANQFVTPYNGQIGKATAVLRNYGCAANIVDIYVLARQDTDQLTEAGNELKRALSDALGEVKMFTDFVCIKDGSVVEVDCQIDLTMDKFYKKFEDEFKQRVTNRLVTFFSLNNWDYGQSLKSIDIVKEVSDIKEIRTVDVNLVTDDEDNSGQLVVAQFYQIVRPQVVEINFIYE